MGVYVGCVCLVLLFLVLLSLSRQERARKHVSCVALSSLALHVERHVSLHVGQEKREQHKTLSLFLLSLLSLSTCRVPWLLPTCRDRAREPTCRERARETREQEKSLSTCSQEPWNPFYLHGTLSIFFGLGKWVCVCVCACVCVCVCVCGWVGGWVGG